MGAGAGTPSATLLFGTTITSASPAGVGRRVSPTAGGPARKGTSSARCPAGTSRPSTTGSASSPTPCGPPPRPATPTPAAPDHDRRRRSRTPAATRPTGPTGPPGAEAPRALPARLLPPRLDRVGEPRRDLDELHVRLLR